MTGEESRDAVDRHRRCWITGTVIASFAALLPASVARALDGLAPEIQAIKTRGRLIVGMANFNSSPFFDGPQASEASADGSELRGWDVDLGRQLAQALEVDVAFDRQWTSFNAVIDAVATGQVDLGLSKLSATAERAVRVHFSRPVITPRHALLINRLSLAKRAGVSDPRSVINREFDGGVGVIAQSSYPAIVRSLMSRCRVQEYGSWNAVVSAVEDGQVDFAYRDEIEIKKIMRTKPDLHLTLKSAIITDLHDSLAAALPSSSRQLQGLVDIIIDSRQKLSVDQILDNYSF